MVKPVAKSGNLDVAGVEGAVVTDKRLLRGARTRETVLRAAVDAASLDGLGGISFGGLASSTGVSKAGIQTLFGSKEALQIASTAYAKVMFYDFVVAPSHSAPAGIARLEKLIERWMAYAKKPLFAGGCFWVVNLVGYENKPCNIRELLVEQQREWRATLAAELRLAVTAGEIADVDADLVAFHIDAVLSAANTALRIGDRDALRWARSIIADILGSSERVVALEVQRSSGSRRRPAHPE